MASKLISVLGLIIFLFGSVLLVAHMELNRSSGVSSEVCSIMNNTLSGTCRDNFIQESFVHPDKALMRCYCYHNKLYLDKPQIEKINKYQEIYISGIVLVSVGPFMILCSFIPWICYKIKVRKEPGLQFT